MAAAGRREIAAGAEAEEGAAEAPAPAEGRGGERKRAEEARRGTGGGQLLSLIHISEPTRPRLI
eukprot:2991377-Rhodomonas_salina.2